MARNTDTLLAFLIGAAAGGITALLLAPEKGEVTRRRLLEGGQMVARRGKDAVGHAVTAVEDAAREKAQTVTHTARQQVGAVREAVTDAKDAYRRELDKGRVEQASLNKGQSGPAREGV